MTNSNQSIKASPGFTEEQIAAINSIDKHTLVAAGAGSGKTFVLVERYIRILAQHPEAHVSDVIAVTYTNKAAEEMRSRLKKKFKELAELAEQSQDTKQKERWLHCLRELDNAKIGTIHSLCNSLLKMFPVEANVDPKFTIIEDLERAELIRSVIDQSLKEYLAAPDEGLNLLLDYPIDKVFDWLGEALNSRLLYKQCQQKALQAGGTQAAAATESIASKITAESLLSAWQNVLTRAFQRMQLVLSKDKEFLRQYEYIKCNPYADSTSDFFAYQENSCRLLQAIFVQEGSSQEEFLHSKEALLALDSMKLSQAKKPDTKLIRETIKAARDIARKYQAKAPANLNNHDLKSAQLIESYFKLADRAIELYQAKKTEQQKVDFDDLIELTHRLLRTKNSNNILYFKERILAVLVDEFQDTNQIQAELLASLVSQKGKLFLIGDDKQSIYRFQGADVGVFNYCRQLINNLAGASTLTNAQSKSSQREPQIDTTSLILTGDGLVTGLSKSFRSHPAIVSFVNTVFALLLNSDHSEQSFRTSFQSLAAARSGKNLEERIDIVEYTAAEDNGKISKAATQLKEARLVAAWIEDKVKNNALIEEKDHQTRPIQWGDFAILVSKNEDFTSLEQALAQANIPYVTYAGKGYLDRQEIFDLENLLRWLADNENSHSLFGALRSPLFGIPDSTLHNIAVNSRVNLWLALRQDEKYKSDPGLQAALHILQDIREIARLSTTGDIIRAILLKTNYDLTVLAHPSGKQKSRNVWKLTWLANKYRHLSLPEFLEALETMRELKIKNLTDAPLTAENCVKLMTIHRSKGLEFPAVALPRLGQNLYGSSRRLLLDKDHGLAFNSAEESKETSAFHKYLYETDKDKTLEERKRLLYVAMTRAKDYLGLWLEKEVARRNESFRELLLEALKIPPEKIDTEIRPHDVQSNNFETRLTIVPEETFCLAMDNFCLDTGNQELARQDTTLAITNELSVPRNRPDGPREKYARIQEVDLNTLITVPAFNPPANLKLAPSVDRIIQFQELVRLTPSSSYKHIHQTLSGTFFHLVMEHLGICRALPDREALEQLITSKELSIAHADLKESAIKDTLKMLDYLEDSTLFGQIKEARRLYPEKSYLMALSTGELQRNRPDLLLEDKNGHWHIIDYKTDQLKHDELSHYAERHKEQLARYRDDLHKLLKVSATASLYFARSGTLYQLFTAAG